MSKIVKYLIINPILFIISIIDFFLNCCGKSNRDSQYKNLPSKPPYSIKVESRNLPNSCTYRSVMSKDLLKLTNPDENIYSAFVDSVKKFPNVKTLGVREIQSIENISQENGKIFKKYNMKNEYMWITYTEALSKVNSLANTLLKLGLKSNDNIVIFSETRAEWLMSALACFRIKATVVTLYATLGLDALSYGVNQTNATFLIASGESLTKVQKILDKIPTIKHIIVFSDKITEKNIDNFRKEAHHINIFTFNEAIDIGKTSEEIKNYEKPKKDDLAVIMYTSGTTGNPKGVMISHANILATLKAVLPRLGNLTSNDTYIAYLPLAHVLELMCEMAFISGGVPIGYSSPFTLSDASTAIKEGDLGDLRVLKPTLLACVPTVLERLSKGVKDKLAKESNFKKTFIETASEKKLKKLKLGKPTQMLDKIIFSKINIALFGGRLRAIICGGALLNQDLQEFSQTYFAPVLQAYGLTETAAGGTAQFIFENETAQVGSVVSCSEIKLVDWIEGGYRVTDKPNPRGEIWIGGDNVTLGYYKMPEKTQEDYHIIDGIRFFSTGDIGEMQANGTLKIVDRKKDLVKLQGGEYVSLNKVESVIKLLPYVDNCCVIADPKQSYCVCLISPNIKKIEEFLSTIHVEIETDKNIPMSTNKRRQSIEILNEFIQLIENDEKLKQQYNKQILDHCLKQGLDKFEIPAKIRFVKETWLPDSGLVTDSLKLKRKAIEEFYKKEIEKLYN